MPLAVYPDTYNEKPLMIAALASQKNHMAVYSAVPVLEKRVVGALGGVGEEEARHGRVVRALRQNRGAGAGCGGGGHHGAADGGYIAASKTAEAKNTIGAIVRAGAAAYERQSMAGSTPVHRLCDSAIAVPSVVPPNKKYQPSTAPGADFNTGSATAGWTCLKFAMESPFAYQYSYVTGAGSGKSGATATGFEASARGDLNGNGVTSVFARGVDVRNGSVVLNPELYIENEFE